MMTVIGYNLPMEERNRRWSDLIEAKRSREYFRYSTDPQEKRMSAIDAQIYAHTLSKYVGSAA